MELTVVDEVHESGRCADGDACSVALKEADLLFDFHVLGELFHPVSAIDHIYRTQEEKYQLGDCVVLVLKLAHRSGLRQLHVLAFRWQCASHLTMSAALKPAPATMSV